MSRDILSGYPFGLVSRLSWVCKSTTTALQALEVDDPIGLHSSTMGKEMKDLRKEREKAEFEF